MQDETGGCVIIENMDFDICKQVCLNIDGSENFRILDGDSETTKTIIVQPFAREDIQIRLIDPDVA